MTNQFESLLSPYRALDLTDQWGFLCGKILGDLGADVVKLEPPGGDPARCMPPFYHDIPDAEKSLYWYAYNNNKRGVTLNLESEEGKDIFRRLARSADFVIESYPPGRMKGFGLGYEALSAVNPRLILTSITPFGQEGPYSSYKASDLTAMAMGGMMAVSGDPDRPPVRVGFPQSYAHAGAAGALASLIAHYHRESTGKGQHVDVSAEECVVRSLMNARLFWDISRMNLKRSGQYRTGLSASADQRSIWPCKDGFVNFSMLGGPSGAKTNRRLAEWMDSEGMGSPVMSAMKWNSFDMAGIDQHTIEEIAEAVGVFFKAHTRGELYAGALKRKVMLYPVNSVADVRADPQLAARRFWVSLEHPELGEQISYPGAFVNAPQAPCRLRRRAPLIGEHNAEVYAALGITGADVARLKEEGVV
ncbi:MAG: CoA transferase [Chloroflexi bacterium]|nr:CoA transferase [Chloroflexota bacterium]